jgi:hypothetical protein
MDVDSENDFEHAGLHHDALVEAVSINYHRDVVYNLRDSCDAVATWGDELYRWLGVTEASARRYRNWLDNGIVS